MENQNGKWKTTFCANPLSFFFGASFFDLHIATKKKKNHKKIHNLKTHSNVVSLLLSRVRQEQAGFPLLVFWHPMSSGERKRPSSEDNTRPRKTRKGQTSLDAASVASTAAAAAAVAAAASPAPGMVTFALFGGGR